MAYGRLTSRRAKKSRRSTKRGGSAHKLVPWGLVLANQLFSKRSKGSTRRHSSKRRRRTRRRRRR
tara:strand:- start:1027 stop:1221 length:195 start_codon:yes stop_codon:yes gene_type:complete